MLFRSLAENIGPDARRAFDRLGESDSIVIDPHKHGLQPYGCGCVMFRDPQVGRFYKHDSPYTYFSSTELHLGEISLECSRPGAAAVGLWATQRMFPLTKGGELARRLERSRAAALALHRKLEGDERFVTCFAPELDIVVWAPRADCVSEVSRRARAIFEEAAHRQLHLALADLPVEFLGAAAKSMERDRPTITCLRSVLMKPEHEAWIGRIGAILDDATDAVLEGCALKERAVSERLPELRSRLEEMRRRLDDEIRRYPTPIPRCDAQFNGLFEQRDRIARMLERLAHESGDEASARQLIESAENILEAR